MLFIRNPNKSYGAAFLFFSPFVSLPSPQFILPSSIYKNNTVYLAKNREIKVKKKHCPPPTFIASVFTKQ